MRWIRRIEEAPGPPEPCAWLVRLDDPAIERGIASPRADDLADAARARVTDGGAGRLWRRRLLRTLAARYLGAAPEALVFARGADGAARLVAPQPLFVSAASRGGWTVVAVGTAPLGVDIETAGADIDGLAAAAATSPAAALRDWTAAEAYAKATGCSLDLVWGLTLTEGVLQAPGWPACVVSHQPAGELTLAAAAER